jgi:hypothetical protein
MAFAQQLKRTVVMGAVLAVAVGAIGAQAQAQPPAPATAPQSGAAPELLLSSLVAPVVVSVVAFFASFAL